MTKRWQKYWSSIPIFVLYKYILNFIQIIAFTHRHFNFDEIGLFHLDDSDRISELSKLKTLLTAETKNKAEIKILPIKSKIFAMRKN